MGVNEVAGGWGRAASGVPEVVTPDAVGLELPVATVGSRGIAWLLDALVLFVGLLIVGVMTAILGGGGFVPGWAGIAVLLLLAFAWQFGYPIGFEVALRGRTPGKAAMGLRVVTVEGAPVGFRHAALRAVVGLFELPVTLGAPAVVSSLVSRRGQRLGDLAAGTMVVRERRVGGPPQATVFVPPPGLEVYTARLDTSAIGPSTYATIRDTLRRAPSLPPEIRLRLTARLATAVLPRVSPPPPAGLPAESWLWCVAASVQGRRRQLGPAPTTGAAPLGSPGAGTVAGTPRTWPDPPPSAPGERAATPAAGVGHEGARAPMPERGGPREDGRRPQDGGFAPPR